MRATYRILIGTLAIAAVANEAGAACTASTRVNGNALTTLIAGNTVCANVGGDKWQEQHRSGGELWDYKKGANDPSDPTSRVGSWSIGANAVTYSYTGGATYTYSVFNDGSSYSFCTGVNGAVVVSGATFKSGNAGCP